MASSEKFCLRWNDFESNVSTAFRDIREEKDFFDVTLACDDSQVEAHKVILAACSPWFRNILRRNPHQHPLLYLKGVKYKELVCVLNFMYQGEVNVAQEELNSFLSVAEELRVKGLTQGNNSTSDNKPKSEQKPAPSRPVPTELPPAPAPKRPRPAPVQSSSYQTPAVVDDDDIQEVVPVKSEPGGGIAADNSGYVGDQGAGAVALDDTYADENYDYGAYGEAGYDDGSGMIDPNTGLPLAGADGNKGMAIFSAYENEEFMSKVINRGAGNGWECLECDYKSHLKPNIRQHVETRHLDLSYPCDICGKIFKSYKTCQMHQKNCSQ